MSQTLSLFSFVFALFGLLSWSIFIHPELNVKDCAAGFLSVDMFHAQSPWIFTGGGEIHSCKWLHFLLFTQK